MHKMMEIAGLPGNIFEFRLVLFLTMLRAKRTMLNFADASTRFFLSFALPHNIGWCWLATSFVCIQHEHMILLGCTCCAIMPTRYQSQ